MREQKYYLVFDEIERGIILRSLNEMRNCLLAEGRYADVVDDLLIRFANAKKKKLKIKITEGIGDGKDNFEEMGGTYERQGDSLIPRLALPVEEKESIGGMGATTRTTIKTTSQSSIYEFTNKRQIEQLPCQY